MTVKELIEKLKEFPEDMTVAITHDCWISRETHQPTSVIDVAIKTHYDYVGLDDDFEFDFDDLPDDDPDDDLEEVEVELE